jgi:hypothetical protein
MVDINHPALLMVSMPFKSLPARERTTNYAVFKLGQLLKKLFENPEVFNKKKKPEFF